MDAAQLEGIPLFASLTRRERRAVARHADEIDLPEGAELVHEGRFSHEFFVLVSGTADVLHGDRRIAGLGPGDFLGEMGVLGDTRRSATVIATSPVTAIVMTAGALRYLARELPSVEQRLRAAVEQRSERLTR